jgi:predicted nuclease with TOPRIM domain
MTSDGKKKDEGTEEQGVVSVYGVPPLVGAIEEYKRLKRLLDAMTLENAELIRERDQVMARRAKLSDNYKKLRVKYQELKMKHKEIDHGKSEETS